MGRVDASTLALIYVVAVLRPTARPCHRGDWGMRAFMVPGLRIYVAEYIVDFHQREGARIVSKSSPPLSTVLPVW